MIMISRSNGIAFPHAALLYDQSVVRKKHSLQGCTQLFSLSRYEGVACEACTSGWVPSQGSCVPYAPLFYTPQLWTKHVAALIHSAPAPAPAVLGREQGAAPGPDSLLNRENATMPGPESQLGDSFAEIESAQAEAAALPPEPEPLNGESHQLSHVAQPSALHRADIPQTGHTACDFFGGRLQNPSRSSITTIS